MKRLLYNEYTMLIYIQEAELKNYTNYISFLMKQRRLIHLSFIKNRKKKFQKKYTNKN